MRLPAIFKKKKPAQNEATGLISEQEREDYELLILLELMANRKSYIEKMTQSSLAEIEEKLEEYQHEKDNLLHSRGNMASIIEEKIYHLEQAMHIIIEKQNSEAT